MRTVWLLHNLDSVYCWLEITVGNVCLSPRECSTENTTVGFYIQPHSEMEVIPTQCPFTFFIFHNSQSPPACSMPLLYLHHLLFFSPKPAWVCPTEVAFISTSWLSYPIFHVWTTEYPVFHVILYSAAHPEVSPFSLFSGFMGVCVSVRRCCDACCEKPIETNCL